MAAEPGIQFLTLDEMVRLYRSQVDPEEDLERMGPLRAVLDMPRSRLGGGFSHRDLFEMAAAYLFHLAHTRPFPRGNLKMAGLATVYFLYLNGWELAAPPEDLARLVGEVAGNRASKFAAADFLRTRCRREDTA